MGLQIEDGRGSGVQVGIDSENNLLVSSIAASLQHHISLVHGEAFQVQSIDTGVTAKTQTILHIKNTSRTKNLIMTYIRLQNVSTGTVPDAGIYFDLGFGDIVVSGGTEVTPVTLNRNSGKTSEALCTGIDPTMADSFTVIDTQYVESNGKEITYNKEGTIILGTNDTFSIRFTTTGTGIAKARVSFLMMDSDN